jgi:phage shock protein C
MDGMGGRRKLHRSRDQRLLFGVCGGLGEYFDLDPNIVRIGFVIAGLIPPLSAIVLIAYVLLAIILPQEGQEDLPGRDVLRRNLDSIGDDVGGLVDNVRTSVSSITGGRRGRDMSVAERPDVPAAGSPPPSSAAPRADEIDRAAAGRRSSDDGSTSSESATGSGTLR